MNAGEWEQIKALFDAALAQPPEQRLQWLSETCGERRELFETVASVLRNYEQCSWPDPRGTDTGPVFSAGQLVADRFLILRPIAAGGMGEVYEARDNHLHGLRVALKTLRLGLVTEQQAHDRFKREVWVAREITHDGVCRMFDLVEHRITAQDGTETVIPCLTMRLLEGENLADFLKTRRPLTVEQALPIIRQVAQSLQAMHDKTIVHRDLKPSNIMLVNGSGGEPRVVLIDFGLAKPISDREDLWQTRTAHMQPGAPYFLAPEVLSGKPASLAADIYAFGLLIDDMVTQSPAFPNKSIEELYFCKLQKGPERPAHRSANLPAHWDYIILRCLSSDPKDRPGSPSELLEFLENPSAAKAFMARSGAPLPVSRRRWMAGSGAALAGVAVLSLTGGETGALNTSILVFPFDNHTQKAEYDYLCSGTVDELIRRLSYVDGLNVYPIRKSWSLEADALKKARFSLQGSLRSVQGKLSLFVKLVENATGTTVWEHAFDEILEKPLLLEADVAKATVDGMRLQLSAHNSMSRSLLLLKRRVQSVFDQPSPDSAALPRQSTASDEAFTEYQKGREFWQQRTLRGALDAINCFNRAIGHDAKYALAYAALADVQQILLNYNFAPTPELLETAVSSAKKAVALDSSLPECHVALAAAKQNIWQWDEAGTSYRLAIQRHERFARAHHWYAGFLLQFARFDEALEGVLKGIQLDPFDYPAQSNYGLYLWNSGRPRDAARQLESVLAKVDLIYAHNVVGQVYAELSAASSEPDATNYFVRSVSEAATVRAKELEAAGGIDPGYLKWSDLISAEAHASRGDHASARHYATRLERGFERGKIAGSAVAWAYAALDNRKRALELLELGFEQREREMLYLRVIPLFRRLHQEPRFQQLLRRMRLV